MKLCWKMNDFFAKVLVVDILAWEPWMNESNAHSGCSNRTTNSAKVDGLVVLRRPLGGWQMRRKAVPRLGA